MQVKVICVDFNSQQRVPGVNLECTVRVAPRIMSIGSGNEDGPAHPPTSVHASHGIGARGMRGRADQSSLCW